jgi:hypothetical protein
LISIPNVYFAQLLSTAVIADEESEKKLQKIKVLEIPMSVFPWKSLGGPALANGHTTA